MRQCQFRRYGGQAREAGAAVIHQGFRGKGNAVRRLFAEVDADIFVMADGDGTYDAASAAALIETLIARELCAKVGDGVIGEGGIS